MSEDTKWPARLKSLAELGLRGKPPVGTTAADVVHRENKWRLLRYRRKAPPKYATPVLLVPSLINRHYVLDLLPGKSLAEWLVAEGHDVFIIDWGTPGDEDRYVTFEDVADKYIGRALRKAASYGKYGKAHLLGYCLGGLLTVVHAIRYPDRVASLLTLAAPIKFGDDGLLSHWARTETFDLDALLVASCYVPWLLHGVDVSAMTPQDQDAWLEEQIDQWRTYLRRRQAMHSVDVAKLEDHLREQIAGLVESGLGADEAFLVAVKRMGALDVLSREFAREHSERLWKQLVVVPADSSEPKAARKDTTVAFSLAVAAAAMVKAPSLFGIHLDDPNAAFYLHNAPSFVLPLLTGYFAWKRRLDAGILRWLIAAFVVAAVFANVYPWVSYGDPHKGGELFGSTEALSVLHLPMALWFVVGIAYAGARWRQVAGRMDFIRFSGELFIYYVLIALGGGVFTGFTLMVFEAIGIDDEPFVQSWLIPCGAAGAVLVASWLVEAKQSVIENMAPVLTRIFTPLFAVMLLTFLGAMLWTAAGWASSGKC